MTTRKTQGRVPPTRAKPKPAAPKLRVSEVGLIFGVGFSGDQEGSASEKAAAYASTVPAEEIAVNIVLLDQFDARKNVERLVYNSDPSTSAAEKVAAFLTDSLPQLLQAQPVIEAADAPA